MKKAVYSALLGSVLALTLAGCGSSASSNTASSAASTAQAAAAESTAASETAESAAAEETTAQTSSGTSKALVIYFDYSENMGDTSNMDVDAITSASLAGMTIDGITRNDLLVMKDEIAKQTGADTFSVRVTEPYDPDYDTMVGVARDDQNNNKQFTFVEDLPDISGYDTIYMGMPVWWGKLPQPMVCFLDQYDFSGKTIIPFGINLGSGFGQMVNQIKEAEPGATVSDDGLTLSSHTTNDEVISDVDRWLSGLQK